MPHRAVIPAARWKRRFLALFAFTVLLPAAILLWLAGRFGGDIPVDYADPVEHFKYGSTGGEHEMGFPYWIWRALPEVCSQYLPGPGYHLNPWPPLSRLAGCPHSAVKWVLN